MHTRTQHPEVPLLNKPALAYDTPAKAVRPTVPGYSADDWTTACKKEEERRRCGRVEGEEGRAKKRVWTEK